VTTIRVVFARCALAIFSLCFAAACGSSDPDGDTSSSTDSTEILPDLDLSSSTSSPDSRRPRHPRPAPTTTGTAPPVPPPPPAPTTPLPYRGVNLSGAEFGSALPGTENYDYTWPTTSEVDYFMAKGMNTFRVNFMWERLQPTAYGEFTAVYGAKLDALVAYATSKHATVLLNPQNFARYYGSTVGSTQVPGAVFADFWRRVALRFKSNPRVIFGLVNEPHDIATEQWVSAANQAIAAIRATGATNTVFVPGNAWTGAHSWNESWYGTSNAVAMLNVVDPGHNMVFEAHQYLDSSSGGQSGVCVSTTIGRERLAPFIAWLRANGRKGFVGEFAGGNNPTCNAAVKDMLNAMHEASDVLSGWLWWGGGAWWPTSYPFVLGPHSGLDAPQMSLLTPQLAGLPLL
jgi:endoglucanase